MPDQAPQPGTPPGTPPGTTPPRTGAGALPRQPSVEDALADAEASLQEMQQAMEGDAQALEMPELEAGVAADAKGIELLNDVDLNVVIELGRTEMLVEDVLRLAAGSVVELDKLAGDPVDVYVNGRLVARGEVLVLNDNFCIRISEILANLEEEVEAAADWDSAPPLV